MLEGLEITEVPFINFFKDRENRLEAEYWNNRNSIKIETFSGEEIIDFVQYGTSEELNEFQLGFPVLRLNEFNSFFIGKPEKYCNTISKKEFENYKLIKDDVLICRTNGNPNLVGRSAIVQENTNYAYASYLFKVRPKNELINSATLVAFLRCKYGRKEIDSYSMVGNQTNFSPAKFREISIPKLSSTLNELIKKTFELSAQKLKKSESEYTEAENILYWELGLSYLSKEAIDTYQYLLEMEVTPPTVEELLSGERDALPDAGDKAIFILEEIKRLNQPTNYNPNNYLQIQQLEKDLELQLKKWDKHKDVLMDMMNRLEQHNVGVTNVNKYQQAKQQNHNTKTLKESFLQSGRIDAEYYQPKYDELLQIIKKIKYNKLGNLVIIKKSIEPGSDAYQNEGIPFIRVANLSKNGLSDTDVHLSKEEFATFPVMPKKDTILLSKDGSVGIAYKVEQDLEVITSGAILHLTVTDKNILPDYLTLVLNSTVVKLQAERDAGGSIIQHWKPSEIEQVIIPELDIAKQTTISQKVQESFALQTQSKQLLQAAKQAVEMAIEQGENVALKYLKTFINGR